MVGAIIGGFTILWVFLTVAVWINGRSTEIFIAEKHEGTRELISKLSELITEMDKRHREFFREILQRVPENR